MTDFERLIPPARHRDPDDTEPAVPVTRSSSFSRSSLARFSLQRFRRRGWTVGVDDGGDECGGPDKENVIRQLQPPPAVAVVGKRVKFDKRVYHGPVRGRPRTAVRGILKTARPVVTGAATEGGNGGNGYTNAGCDDAVPNRMRMYDVPVTSFYIGAGEHLQLPPLPAKRGCSSVAGAACLSKKTRRFGTDIGSY